MFLAEQRPVTACTCRQNLRPAKSHCIHRRCAIRPHGRRLWLHWTTFLAKESGVNIEQLDTEVIETVAGLVRLLRRAAELAWASADEGGPR
jgi:hypothetical protein